MSDREPEDVTLVIGLETHVQLKTRSKLFCGCSTEFGAPPNTQTCPVCLGLPGSLPVMNQEAFRLAVKTALALNCRIPEFTKWDRKNYFYPDLPKGYQISQFDLPMSEHGYLAISDPKNRFAPKDIRILRAHLEEDAGKSMHDEQTGQTDTRIDLNRTGTPLLEIVSHPDMRSALEAKAYLSELKLLLTYLDVSDCNMQEGSLRVDANVNLHIQQGPETFATPIVEIKNLNSFRAVERALEYEAQRQLEHWRKTGEQLGQVPKQTRGWDEHAQLTRAQRTKEESSDYRYFPEPDLVPVTVTRERVRELADPLGELPANVRKRLEQQYALSAYDADVMVNQGRAVVDYFEELAALAGDAKRASNWVQQDILRLLKEQNLQISEFPLSAAQLAPLLQAIGKGQLDTTRAKEVFQRMWQQGQSSDEAMRELGIVQLGGSELETLCRQLLAANPQIIEDFRNGKQQAIGALIGQARKANPNANPGLVRQKLIDLLQN